ncbi:MAG: hypothetical protein US89_C0009G0052 [Candidatus Peregrinibacteria bacterium GW2011_GWF2_38_29]|nr:MAG: hypothetical protein US89_C0009G0052 [Candidatus Peregrinibacteria bacterium GW2011_GWF2_38_29]HBB02766.1 hypothetical protein [Candidatus Peregrinibacteria bacterium]
MDKKERVYVYIDGSNLYHNLRRSNCGHINFNFKKFVNYFVKDRKLEGVGYYIGQIRPIDNNKKSQRLHRFQQIGNIFTEKGVDVRIAIDLVEGAYENRYDKAILISSDGDLAPAIEMVKRKNKAVEIVSFKDNPSYLLMQKANYKHFIDKVDLQRFVIKL